MVNRSTSITSATDPNRDTSMQITGTTDCRGTKKKMADRIDILAACRMQVVSDYRGLLLFSLKRIKAKIFKK